MLRFPFLVDEINLVIVGFLAKMTKLFPIHLLVCGSRVTPGQINCQKYGTPQICLLFSILLCMSPGTVENQQKRNQKGLKKTVNSS